MDIHKLFLDRGFSSKETRGVIDRRELLYVFGKPARAEVDKKNIEEIKLHDVYESRIGHGTHEYDSREHDITHVYTPSKKDEDKYAVFAINEHVDHPRADATTDLQALKYASYCATLTPPRPPGAVPALPGRPRGDAPVHRGRPRRLRGASHRGGDRGR